MKHSLLLHPLNLVSLLTRLWLDDIFNLFVQRSLAYWGKKKRERWLGRKMSRHRNTFVSGRVRYVAVIYGSTYVCDMKGHSSRSSSERGSRMLAEEFQCDAWAIHHCGRPSVAWRSTFNTSTSHFEDTRRWHQGADAALLNAPWCQQRFGLTRGLNRNQPLKP